MDHAPGLLLKLESTPLFQGVSHSLLLDAIGSGRRIDLARGAILLRPGIPNSLIYIILSGRVSLMTAIDEADPLAMYGEGDCIGEMAILDDGGSDSTYAIAATDCQLFALDQKAVWTLIDSSHEAAHNMLKILAQRIRVGNRRIQDNLEQHHGFTATAMVDPLTGLYNRTWLNEKIERFLERCAVTSQPGSFILLEMDDFDGFSENHGELGSDEAIRTIAHTLLDCMRPDDQAGHLTVRRFGVFLPNTPLCPHAQTAAERLRSAVNRASVVLPSGDALPPVSISLGIAPVKAGDSVESLVGRAEEALGKAISAGGNRICSLE